jgi:hypothetical protein
LPNPDETEYEIYDEFLWEYPAECETNCDLIRHSLSDGQVTNFVLPTRTLHANRLRPLDQFGDSTTLVIEENTFWLLHTDKDAEIIGYVSPGSMPTYPNQILSPDGRWLLLADTPDDFSTGFGIWDSEKQLYVLEEEIPDERFAILMNYQQTGFIFTQIKGNQRSFRFFRYEDSSLIELPIDRGIYFDALTDGRLLYNGFIDTQGLPLGIYSYDPDQQSYELIVQDALALTIPPTPSEPLLLE